MAVVLASFFLSPDKDILTLIASLTGAFALIFVAKGYVFGQLLTLLFAIFYGIVSLKFRYYGEMITYLGMSAPMAVFSIISWLKNPYGNTKVVKVADLSVKAVGVMSVITVFVTAGFGVILVLLDTPNIVFSIISVTTSFVAAYLTFLRSPYYAVAYAANDVVLIVLWVLASIEEPSYIPMIACFVIFLFNDIYGFINWRRLKEGQKGVEN